MKIIADNHVCNMTFVLLRLLTYLGRIGQIDPSSFLINKNR